MSTVREAIDALRAWADSTEGAELRLAPAAEDAEARLAAPRPSFGNVPKWALPPSYREQLTLAASMRIKWGPSLGHEEFEILAPRGIKGWSGIVYLPGDIMEADDMSTNHLVPFASGGNDECAFCFDVTTPDPDGEYPVYYHHQDQPRARSYTSGKWLDEEDATPDFPSFAAWLRWVAAELMAGREPESSYPSAFYKMPGRAK